VPVPKRCTNTHPILRVSFDLCDRRITLRDLSTIRTVTRPVIWREQALPLMEREGGPASGESATRRFCAERDGNSVSIRVGFVYGEVSQLLHTAKIQVARSSQRHHAKSDLAIQASRNTGL